MLSNAALNRFRAIADKGLPDTAAIQRRTPTPDAAGGRTQSAWAAVSGLEAVPCRFARSEASPHDGPGPVGPQVTSLWRFRFPAGTDVRPTDRIVVGARTWEVVEGGGVSYEVARTVTAMEVH